MLAVTGATGLLGSQLLYTLTQKGKQVKALYQTKEKIDAVRQFFELVDKESSNTLWQQITWIKADVRDYMDLTEAFEGVEAVFHTAALVSFRKADKNDMKAINWQGTNNVVNACLEANVAYLCFVSSVASLDGVEVEGKVIEALSNAKLKEKLYYGNTKFDAEKEVFRGIAEGLKASVVNPSIILGYSAANQSSASLFHRVYNGMPIYSKGSTDFVDARDVADICYQLYEKQMNAERFILSNEHLSYKDLLSQMAEQLGKKPPKYVLPLFWAKAFAGLSEFIRPKSTQLTKSNVVSAYEHSYYSNKKVTELLEYKFIPVKESIAYYANLYLKPFKK
jgi:nucleoside-diphosphate-sugar epimerase